MRHGKKVKKLGRTHAHRKATLAALSTALITHKRITTTLAKAKALRGFVEPVIHRAKEDTTHNRRQAFRRLGSDKEATKLLFGEIAEVLGDRPGGYTRVVKLGQRPGDAAEMAVIELVDFNDVKPEGASAAKRKTRRSRRKTTDEGAVARAPKAAAPKAEPKAAATGDDFTKLFGIGDVFAGALQEAGIRTYAQLAKADLYTLRDAIQEHTSVSDESANEETWAQQAAFAASGDWEGHAAYVAEVKAGGTPTEAAAEAPAAEEAPEEAPAEETPAPADAMEAPAADSDPGEASTSQIPLSSGVPEHGDAEQGATTRTGEPPPEAGLEGQSGHRG
ncbi:MAG TPA: 50S ribosomal protein L17 [Rhodothermales bacterium]|nr:50S ribosomal protein L17 [Rhodothermales bacterium]